MGFFKWLSGFLGDTDVAKKTAETIERVRVRARDARGRFVADDPETEKNEAYEEEHPRRP